MAEPSCDGHPHVARLTLCRSVKEQLQPRGREGRAGTSNGFGKEIVEPKWAQPNKKCASQPWVVGGEWDSSGARLGPEVLAGQEQTLPTPGCEGSPCAPGTTSTGSPLSLISAPKRWAQGLLRRCQRATGGWETRLPNVLSANLPSVCSELYPATRGQ